MNTPHFLLYIWTVLSDNTSSVKVRIEEMKEIDIKLKIVEFLLNSEPADTYLAAEVRFSLDQRVVKSF